MRLLSFFLFFTVVSSAQINEGAFDDYIYFINQSIGEYDGIEGTPYLSDDFVPANINDSKKVVFIRFNAYANSVEFKKPNGDVVFLSLEQKYRFKLIGDSSVEYEIHSYINDKGKKENTFFRKVHTDNNFTLFLKEKVKLIPIKIARSGFEQDQPSKFIKSKGNYYIDELEQDSSELFIVPTRKKDIQVFFKEDSKLIQQFVKKQKLKMDNKDDLVTLFKFYKSKN